MKWLNRIGLTILLFVAVNSIGYYLWPFAAYLTRMDIGVICYIVSGIIAVLGIILLVYALVSKEGLKLSLWTLLLSVACFSCCISYIWERFGENGHYVDGYIWSNKDGLCDKFGKSIFHDTGDACLKVFDNKRKAEYFVVIKVFYINLPSEKIDTLIMDNPYVVIDSLTTIDPYSQISTVRYSFFDLSGKRIDDFQLNKMCCENPIKYVKKHIGRIITIYSKNSYKFASSNYLAIKSSHDIDDNQCPTNSATIEDKSHEYNAPERGTSNTEENRIVETSDYSPQYETRDEWVNCYDCNGSGNCRYCHGKGECISTWSDGSYNDTYKCGVCYGTGRCQSCYGNRGHYEKRTYQVR